MSIDIYIMSIELVRTYRGHTNIVVAVCKLNDKQFVSGSNDATLKLWNVGKEDAVLAYNGHNGRRTDEWMVY